MQILIIISLVSLGAIVSIFYKKTQEINCQIREGRHCGDVPNFFEQYIKIIKIKLHEVCDEVSVYMTPHVHAIASVATKQLYKISSGMAQESLRVYNFIQGKKTLKNARGASLFIRDMAKHK
ncbi:MAG: hypothetical protein HZA94_02970 [Candidatus Vogelbacteria bacterium]|nr:hypothetical protein [Candidatus Vogelbacteria bacterium]